METSSNTKFFKLSLYEGKGSQTLGQHRSLEIFQIVIDGRDLPSVRVAGRAFTTPRSPPTLTDVGHQ